jgi:tRNA/tmRNA/rRNA uracil-C5-methylase (TrmA/RlmC/RlmD family)
MKKRVIIDDGATSKHNFRVSINEAIERTNRILEAYKETGLPEIKSTGELKTLLTQTKFHVCEAANSELLKILKVEQMFEMLNLPNLQNLITTIERAFAGKIVNLLEFIEIKKGQAVAIEPKILAAMEKMVIYATTPEEIAVHEAKEAIKAGLSVLKNCGLSDREILRDIGFQRFAYRNY